MRCKAIKTNGEQCETNAFPGKEFCFFHLSGKEKGERRWKQSNQSLPQKSIVEFMQDDCNKIFKDRESWEFWETFLKTVYALPLTGDDMAAFRFCTQREQPPTEPFEEVYAIASRRAGKSFISAFIAVYEALYNPSVLTLAPGEKGYIFIVATDRRQARIVLDYGKGILSVIGQKAQVLKEEIEIGNVVIAVKTASFRADRGFTTLLIILDELAFFRDETSSNPAVDIVDSLLPGLVEGGKLIGISTPYARSGFLFEQFEQNFAKDSNILIWKCPTQLMNPQVSEKKIEKLIKKGKAMHAEFYAEFREDLENYLSREELEIVMTAEEHYVRDPEFQYFAFVDPSGGRNDSFTLAIGHWEKEKIIVDRLEERIPPFDTSQIVEEYAEILKQFGIMKISGDRFGGVWTSDAFKKHGIEYEMSPLVKNDLLLEFVSLVRMREVLLPKNQRLLLQSIQLERRPGKSGKDEIQKLPGFHDDLLNEIAGLTVLMKTTHCRQPSEQELLARLPHMGVSGGSVPGSFLQEARRACERAISEGYLPPE
jgi:hypothetical protein